MSGKQVCIEIEHLTKRYGTLIAVKDLNLSVGEGEIFGFVGPNGAGKTTTIRMLSTLLQPTQGEIRVAGHSINKDMRQVRKAIGYMPDFFGVYNDMKVWEYLDFFAACYAIPERQRPGLISDLLELVDLAHRRDDWVDRLSRGMKQRLSLARTLVHDPQVLILDEPASGLDPRARIEIRELMVELSRMGKTIFFSTHILADVAEICTRVAIIEAGQLVAVGELEELHRRLMPVRTSSPRRVELTLLGPAEAAQAVLSTQPGVMAIQTLGNSNETNNVQEETEAPKVSAPDQRRRLEIDFNGTDAELSQVLAALVAAGVPVLHFNEDQRDLEQVFLQATKGVVS